MWVMGLVPRVSCGCLVSKFVRWILSQTTIEESPTPTLIKTQCHRCKVGRVVLPFRLTRRLLLIHALWIIVLRLISMSVGLFMDAPSFLLPRSGELQTQKLKSHLLRTQSLKVLPLKPEVGQCIAIHVTLTARDFFLANFYPSGPFACIFS